MSARRRKHDIYPLLKCLLSCESRPACLVDHTTFDVVWRPVDIPDSKEKGGDLPTASWCVCRLCLARRSLEVQPQRHLNDAWMAAEDKIGAVEERWVEVDSEQRRRPRSGLPSRLYAINRAGRVLRVVEGVVKVGPELNLDRLGNLEVFEDREV